MIIIPHFANSIRTQSEIDKLMSLLYNDKTIYGSWNFDVNPSHYEPDIHDLELVLRNYIDYINDNKKSEIYCFRIACIASSIKASLNLERMVHPIRIVYMHYRNFRVIYCIYRKGSYLILEFYIIPYELSTGDICKFYTDREWGEMLKISDRIFENQIKKRSEDK